MIAFIIMFDIMATLLAISAFAALRSKGELTPVLRTIGKILLATAVGVALFPVASGLRSFVAGYIIIGLVLSAIINKNIIIEPGKSWIKLKNFGEGKKVGSIIVFILIIINQAAGLGEYWFIGFIWFIIILAISLSPLGSILNLCIFFGGYTIIGIVLSAIINKNVRIEPGKSWFRRILKNFGMGAVAGSVIAFITIIIAQFVGIGTYWFIELLIFAIIGALIIGLPTGAIGGFILGSIWKNKWAAIIGGIVAVVIIAPVLLFVFSSCALLGGC